MDSLDSLKLHLAYGDTKKHLKDGLHCRSSDLFGFLQRKKREEFHRNAKAALQATKRK